jgi:hypothetical protein
VSKAEELREGMIQQYALSPREIEPMRRRLEVLLAAAHAEGVEEERKRLMSLLALLVMYEGVVSYSLLAPKEKP